GAGASRSGEVSSSGPPPPSWSLGLQTADLVVHAWDIARATGQPANIDPDLAGFALEWGRANLKPEFRGDESAGQSFGMEIPVPDDAPIDDRMAGFFGRDPSWGSSG